jgi:hypothetical protein
MMAKPNDPTNTRQRKLSEALKRNMARRKAAAKGENKTTRSADRVSHEPAPLREASHSTYDLRSKSK